MNSIQTNAGICLLRCYDRITAAYDYVGRLLVARIRRAVGKEPERVLILPTGEVLPSSLQGVDPLGAFVYDPDTRRILPMRGEPVGRLRALPFIALRIDERDLSDWIGEIRAVSLVSLTALQVVRLWSLSHSVYVPPGSSIYAVNSMGEETTTSFL